MKNENQGPIRKDDPRITSYVLGERAELTNRECDEIRTLLDSDPELRAEVEGLSAFAGELQAEMAAEPGVELSSAQREAIAEAAGPPVRSFMPRLVGGGLLAASIAFGAFHLHRSTSLETQHSDDEQLAKARINESTGRRTALDGLSYIGDKGISESELTDAPAHRESAAPTPADPRVFGQKDGLAKEAVAAEAEPGMHRENLKPTSEDLGRLRADHDAKRLEVRRYLGPGEALLPGSTATAVQSESDNFFIGHGDSGGVVRDEFSRGAGAAPSGPASPGSGGPSSPGPNSPVTGALTSTTETLSAGLPVSNDGRRHRQGKDVEGKTLRELRSLGYVGDDGEDGYSFDRRGKDASNNESYEAPPENRFTRVDDDPLSTFSIDVDTAGYANVRRFLTQGQRPPADAVRLEEMVNYFSYDYPQPVGNDPFSVSVETADCPWAEGHRLMQVGLKGKQFSDAREQGRNLVFLMDVSGSMNSPNKLPLLKSSFEMLLDHMSSTDRVAIVVYAGAAGVVLPSTQAANRGTILAALNDLKAGGSTNGGAGIQLAYNIAQENFIKGGINRVILATDGDFNVGRTDRSSLVQMIEEKAKSGVFLTVLGYGMGNLKDATMEQLADKGNGNYAYIDNLNEARKVLVTEADATLETIAKDVKIQLEFNPGIVAAWRLVGYENRVLAHQDFNDDTKDAGEIGAGHTVTAIYEIVPVGMSLNLPGVDSLKYQRTQAPTELSDAAASGEMLTVKLRYKQPDGDTSQLIEVPVHDARRGLSEAPADFRFACAVAGFGMILKGSAYKGSLNLDLVRELALAGAERDPFGYRHEFLQLVERARQLGVK